MSDREVAQALRSSARLVLVEAPAGCGKTFQGAEYAKDLLGHLANGRLLVLTHTHAASDVFANRTRGVGNRVEIRTIDSLITQIAGAYHQFLDLPADVTAWAYQQSGDGFDRLAARVDALLTRAPVIAASLATRYPFVVCDEHQDSSEAQHRIIMAIHRAGARLRIFGDPMQMIYGTATQQREADRRWSSLQMSADSRANLDTPHRWHESQELGEWILEARSALSAGREITLRRDLPQGLKVFRADNKAQRHGQYMLDSTQRRPIDEFVNHASHLFVLTTTNELVRSLNASFNRRLLIWEGHTRNAAWNLAQACKQSAGQPMQITEAFVTFVQSVATGFSKGYADAVRREVAEGCSVKRSKKPAKIQEIARLIMETPDHRGAAQALEHLRALVSTDAAFDDIRIDLKREYGEAIRLSRYEDVDQGLTQLNLLRTVSRSGPPERAISTIHKAKGLETESVLVMPCDREQFPSTDTKRRRLYVAMSRATKSLALVIPNGSPSPLFRI